MCAECKLEECEKSVCRCNHTREAQLTRVYIYMAVYICRLTPRPRQHCRYSVVSCFVMSPSHAFKDVSVDLSRGQPPIDLVVQPDFDFAKLSRLDAETDMNLSKKTQRLLVVNFKLHFLDLGTVDRNSVTSIFTTFTNHRLQLRRQCLDVL